MENFKEGQVIVVIIINLVKCVLGQGRKGFIFFLQYIAVD